MRHKWLISAIVTFALLAFVAGPAWAAAPTPTPKAPPAPTAATAVTAGTAATATTAGTAVPTAGTAAGDENKDDRVTFGSDVTVAEGDVVKGDVVVTGGDLYINGTVNGDAVCTGGDITLGPKGEVKGDVVVTGGVINAPPTAKIGGSKVVVAGKGLEGLRWLKWGDEGLHWAKGVISLVKEIAFFGFLMLIALLLNVFLPKQFGRIEQHLTEDFPRSALLGVAAMVLLPLALAAMVISLIGIPLAPLVVIAAIIAALIGYVSIGRLLGARIVKNSPVMVQALVGLAILQAAAIIGDLLALPGGVMGDIGKVFQTIGTIVALGGSFLGMGAVIYSRFGSWDLARSQAAFKKNGNGGGTPAKPDAIPKP